MENAGLQVALKLSGQLKTPFGDSPNAGRFVVDLKRDMFEREIKNGLDDMLL
jgi:hypothetical protein